MSLVGCPEEMVLSVSFLVTAAVEFSSATVAVVAFAGTFTFAVTLSRGSVKITFVSEVSSTTISVVGLAVFGTSTFVMASIRGSVKTESVSLVTVFTESPVITPRVTSTAAAIVSASITTDVVDGSLVSTIDGAVVSGVAVSVNGSVDASVLDLMVTVEKSFVTFVSIFSSTGKCVAVSASAAVGDDFVVSTAFFCVVTWVLLESLISFVTFPVASVVWTGETEVTVSFSLIAAVKVSSTIVTVVGLAILRTSASVVTSVRGLFETKFMLWTAVVTGTSVVTSAVTSNSGAIPSACVNTDVFDAAVVSGRDEAVLSGVVVSVTDSMNFLVLASVVTVETFVVTSVSTMTATDTAFVMSVDAAVVGFVFSTTCFSAVAWAVVCRPTSLFAFSVALVVCRREAVLSVSFSVTAAVELSSRMVEIVGLPILATFIFVLASVRGSLETAFASSAAGVT